ncbi:MAG: PilX N-terminal domain-containing pilus assembly protein [Gammaproteobacteria bacterium]|nr:PilX N-terminal domain-containing pilus assembly protein [Gammaproteobacteria bacterium]
MTISPQFSGQRGAALFSSLIVLLVVSVIALSAARSSALEMLIATNQQNSVQALANGEDSVLLAERYVGGTHSEGGPTFDFTTDITDGLYLADAVDVETTDWSAFTTEDVLDADGNLVNRYVVEYLGTRSATGGSLAVGSGSGAQIRHMYRLTGLGVGPKGTTRIVQTIFATR